MDTHDVSVRRKLDGWTSSVLGQPMPIASWGSSGRPLLLFPTAGGDYLENERFDLVRSVEPFVISGKARVFSIDSINRQAWLDPSLPVAEQAKRQALYAQYVEQEVVPYVRSECGNPDLRIATAGASFGAFHAANTLFRRPDLFDTVIAMSGFYDLAPDYLRGYSDDDCYYNNPVWYLPRLTGKYLDLLRESCSINIVTGQGAWETPDASFHLSSILSSLGIPHTLDLWGYDVNHDWPWWRKMLPLYLEKLGW